MLEATTRILMAQIEMGKEGKRTESMYTNTIITLPLFKMSSAMQTTRRLLSAFFLSNFFSFHFHFISFSFHFIFLLLMLPLCGNIDLQLISLYLAVGFTIFSK